MANIYVRVPHYVASYLRNRIEDDPTPLGQPIRMELGDPWYMPFIAHIDDNPTNVINIDCFSETQWLAMRRGEPLSIRNGLVTDIPRKRKDQPLTMYDIYSLSGRNDLIHRDEDGKPLSDSDYPDEYIPFQMPKTIVRRGRECRIRGDWFLRSSHDFIEALRTQFKMIFVKFVAQDQYYSNALASSVLTPDTQQSAAEQYRQRTRARMESIDRFMLRYDIRCGDREREGMKKVLMRAIKSDAFALDADANHAAWIVRDRDRSAASANMAHPLARKILLVETGQSCPSINATLRMLGLDVTTANRNNLRRAIARNYRFHGVHVQYDDIPEVQPKRRAEPDKYVLAMRDKKQMEDEDETQE